MQAVVYVARADSSQTPRLCVAMLTTLRQENHANLLTFAALVYEYQRRNGKLGIAEHPQSHVHGARKPSRRCKVVTLMWTNAAMVFNFPMAPAWSTQCRNQLVSGRQEKSFMTFLRANAMDNIDTRNSKAQSLPRGSNVPQRTTSSTNDNS